MITGATPYHPNGPQGTPIYFHSDEVISSCLEPSPAIPHTSSTSFLYSLALLKDKVLQAHSMATSILLSPDPPESTAVAVTTMGTLIQEIVVTASTTMFACQQLAIGAPSCATNNVARLNHHGENGIADGAGRALVQSGGLPTVEDGTAATFYVNHHETLDRQWYGTDSRKICNADDGNSNINTHDGSPTDEGTVSDQLAQKIETNDEEIYSLGFAPNNNQDIIELDAASLLAKYTHYCQVCGKGFKRDANRRMHMRAHGDEYKSSAALSSPLKNFTNTNGEIALLRPRKYSCPHEGCRWNKKHAKFQPLKSMICVKNHYKRTHCPKMYVCKRCNRKKFSVLSDLRSHEKHCGELRWQCSCGTSFSRKDKLMGHVALFVGHTPAINASTKTENIGG